MYLVTYWRLCLLIVSVMFFSGQLITCSLDKKLFFWDTNARSVNPYNTLMLESVVGSLSVCGMYILVAVERDVYWYDMRNLTGPIKAKDSPLKHHIRCLHSSEQLKGMYISLFFRSC
jgi:cell cycle arrest protein BUB3